MSKLAAKEEEEYKFKSVLAGIFAEMIFVFLPFIVIVIVFAVQLNPLSAAIFD